MIFDCNFINDKAAIDKSCANDLSSLSQQKTKVGGACTNGDSGRSSTPSDLTRIISRPWEREGKNVKSISIRHRNTRFGKHSSWSTIPDRSGEMQCIRAIVDCGATSIFMTPRLPKWLGISHQAALITTLAMTGGVMQHAKDTGRRGSQSSTWTISHR